MVGILLNAPPRLDRREPARPRPLGRPGYSPHERRVAAVALRMFDLLAPHHMLGPKYRQTLRTAALLHDAAKAVGAAADHHIRGAHMVLRDPTLASALSPRRRRAVAYMVRYHRGGVADVDRILQPGDRRRKLRILLGLLRAADALDSRHLAATAIIMRRTPRKLRIECLVRRDPREARARFHRPDKFKLLEKTLGLRVHLRVRQILP